MRHPYQCCFVSVFVTHRCRCADLVQSATSQFVALTILSLLAVTHGGMLPMALATSHWQ